MTFRHLWMIAACCAVIGIAQPGYADSDNAPNAYFVLGGNIFETGQSNNIGPAANTVLDEGMYWFTGDCSPDQGDTEDCDLLRFGAGLHPLACNDGSAAEINQYLPPREDGGQAVQDALSNIQNNAISPYCNTEPTYRPVDEILVDHQNKLFAGTYDDEDSPWVRPNLNLMVISDIPQTSDTQPHGRALGALQSTCRLLHGKDGAGDFTRPAMPSWVMMAREHTSDAAVYGGLLAAAGGTGQCCHDPNYNPNNPNAQPCDPTDPNQQIDLCSALSGFTETNIRQDIANGKFQCAPGSGVQTGSMDFGEDTKGTLPHILCHFAGSNGHSNCSSSETDNSKRRPTNVLGKMACIRQLPRDENGNYTDGPIWLCDRDDDCRQVPICDGNNEPCVQFVDPNETLFTLVGTVGGEEDGQTLCSELADGGEVIVGCPNVGDNCTVDGAEGRCSAGRTVCENGREVCEPKFEAMPEICNGLDDDCDGGVDNLSTSWDNFSQDPTKLGSYDSDGVDREAIHCNERDVCRCSNGDLTHGGPGYEAHIMSWVPGSCHCAESLEEPAGYDVPAPDTRSQPSAGCSSAATGGAVGAALWWILFGVFLWRRRT